MADKRPLGVWEVPEGLGEMTEDELDQFAEEIGDSMAVVIERREQIPPKAGSQGGVHRSGSDCGIALWVAGF